MLQGAKEISKKLSKAGYETYLVGGCVRDILLGREPKDYDIATAATPDNIKALFDRVIPVGESFGVIRVLLQGKEYEIATFRSDGDYDDKRRPNSVKFTSAAEDVKRRDFTINALLMDPTTMGIIDYVGGKKDIEDKVIRAVGDAKERFAEDELRMVRAVRFAAQLGFNIDPDTRSAIIELKSRFFGVSKERITQELSKIWNADAGEGWRIMQDVCILNSLMPFVSNWRREGAFDRLTSLSGLTPDEKEAIGWALALSDVDTYDVHNHLSTSLRLSRKMMSTVGALLGSRELLQSEKRLSTVEGLRLLTQQDAKLFIAYQKCFVSDEKHPAFKIVNEIMHSFVTNPVAFDQIPSGNDLIAAGFKEGATLGKALSVAKDLVLMRKLSSKKDVIDCVCKELK